MKKNLIWTIMGILAVLSLVAASCAPTTPSTPAPTTPTTPATQTAPTAPTTPTTPTAAAAKGETPRYGGVFNQGLASAPLYFDETKGVKNYTGPAQITNEELVMGDWAKGPGGSGEANFFNNFAPPLNLLAGQLAESWELTGPDSVIFHIRKGVKWHNKPPVNGRELVADDIVFSLKRTWTTPTSYHTGGYPWASHFESITAPDKSTVVVKCLAGKLPRVWAMLSNHVLIVPPEMVQKYGDMADWRNSCGTGPFILTDYVEGSSATLVRNPNYWQKDPIRPQNQLPYLDGVKMIIIPDTSTRMAALRTAKIDQLGGPAGMVGWEDAGTLKKTNPELKYVRYSEGYHWGLFFPQMNTTAPYNDLKVRRALSMGIDRKEMVNTFFGGNAEVYGCPVANLAELKDAFTPLDQLPPECRELYEYNPEKAKQLLTEAGYPNGFKTEIVCQATDVDLLSIVKAYWAKIGVDLKIDVKEAGVYSSIGFNRTAKHMYFFSVAGFLPYRFLYWLPENTWNHSQVNDPVINKAIDAISPVFFDEARKAQIMKDITPHIVSQVTHVDVPFPSVYVFWQPWVGGYHGELYPGYSNYYWYVTYIWLDQDIKEKLTGKR